MVQWKITIRRAADLPHLATQLAKNRRRHRTADATAAIDDNF